MHSCKFLLCRSFSFFRFSSLVTGFPSTPAVSVRPRILLLPLVTFRSSLFYPRSPSYQLVSVFYRDLTKMICIAGLPLCKIYFFPCLFPNTKPYQDTSHFPLFCMGLCLCSVPFCLDCNLMGQVLCLVILYGTHHLMGG